MNKLMARIVAVVLAVMMLGTVSFAATTATKDAIETDIAERAMYTVKAKNADGEIIAMYQNTTAPTSIAINPEKVAVGEKITVEYGGVTGGYLTQEVVVEGKENLADVAVTKEIKVGDVTYTDVACASKLFTPGEGKTTKRVGFNLKSSKGTKAEGLDFGYDVAISGTGSVTYDVVILQVPADVTITATPYIVY